MGRKIYIYKYARPAVAVDCVVFGFDGRKLKVLIIRRGNEPFKGDFALPGGFVKIADNESCEDAARRELEEETHLKCDYLEQFHTFSDPYRDPSKRVISVAYLALVRTCEVKGGDDAQEAEWIPLDYAQALHLAYDHNEILDMAVKELRNRIHFSPIGFGLLPEKFTMRQLQRLYEAVINEKLDRRNFAKRMLYLDILTPLNEFDTESSSRGRDAMLYSFNEEKYNQLHNDGIRLDFLGYGKRGSNM